MDHHDADKNVSITYRTEIVLLHGEGHYNAKETVRRFNAKYDDTMREIIVWSIDF